MITSLLLSCALVSGQLNPDDGALRRITSLEDLRAFEFGQIDLGAMRRLAQSIADRFGLPPTDPAPHEVQPEKVTYNKQIEVFGLLFYRSRISVTASRATGRVSALSATLWRSDGAKHTVEHCLEKADAFVGLLPTPYPLTRQWHDEEDDPDKVYIEYHMTVPGVEPPLFGTATVILNRWDGDVICWLSYPPRPTPLAGPVLPNDRLAGIAVGAVFGMSGWREAGVNARSPVWEAPAYFGYPNALTEDDVRTVKSGGSLLVSVVTVHHPDSWSEARRSFTRAVIVWVQADTGRVLAAAPTGLYEGSAPPAPTTRREGSSLAGLWKAGGASGRLERVRSVPLGPVRQAVLTQGDRALVADFDPSSGVLCLRVDGRRVFVRPSDGLLRALLRDPGVPSSVGLSPPTGQG